MRYEARQPHYPQRGNASGEAKAWSNGKRVSTNGQRGRPAAGNRQRGLETLAWLPRGRPPRRFHHMVISLWHNRLRLLGVLSPVLAPSATLGQSPAWESLKVETTASFRGLSVVDDRVVWASGTRGTVIRTIDGGTTWSVESLPGAATFDLRGIHARNANVAHVAATSGRIWRTTDGGRSWSLRYQLSL